MKSEAFLIFQGFNVNKVIAWISKRIFMKKRETKEFLNKCKEGQ